MRTSDLAVEFSKKLISKKDYLKVEKRISKNIKSVTVDIKSNEMSKKYGREQGFYALLNIPFSPLVQSIERETIKKELVFLVGKVIEKCGLEDVKSCLIVGLGNPKLTADCFGPKVVEKVLTTRHAVMSVKDSNLCAVSKISTNVFGQTGLESFDIIKGVVDSINPELVILIDTLVASSYKRLCTNIQIASVGIVPGSGVDNARQEISAKTLSVPVITIGVPFVVYATDLVEEKIAKLGVKKSGKNIESGIKDLIIMPREIDQQLSFCSGVVAESLNECLNPHLSKQDFETFFV